jgi:alpha-ketoglutarate-dependent taurine dioxygenase
MRSRAPSKLCLIATFLLRFLSYTARPPRVTMLYALEVPMENGVALGATHFASAAAAYAG